MAHESGSDTNCNWCVRYSHQRIPSGIGGVGYERKRVQIIQITALLSSTKNEFCRLENTCYHSNFSEKQSANTEVKTLATIIFDSISINITMQSVKKKCMSLYMAILNISFCLRENQ